MKKNKNIICGKWIVENTEKDWKDPKSYKLFIKCSECGLRHFLGTTRFPNEYNEEKIKNINFSNYLYCSHCGAKMINE